MLLLAFSLNILLNVTLFSFDLAFPELPFVAGVVFFFRFGVNADLDTGADWGVANFLGSVGGVFFIGVAQLAALGTEIFRPHILSFFDFFFLFLIRTSGTAASS
jgi:hypothetical protein